MNEYNKLLDALVEQINTNQTAFPDSISKIPDIIRDTTLAELSVLKDKLINFFQSNIGFIKKLRAHPQTLKSEEKIILTEVISWVFSSINTWEKTDEKSIKLLISIFIIAEFVSHDGYLWDILPLDLNNTNPKILNIAEELIKSISFSINVPDDAPVYEKDFLLEIQDAISEDDLSALSRCLQIIDNNSLIHPDMIFKSCCRCVASHCIKRLAHIITEKNNFYFYISVSNCLNTSQNLLLASLSGSDSLSLIVLEKIYCNKKAELSDSDIENTVGIVKRMTEDMVKLKIWMEIFNRYPARYPMLQKVLGQFLAASDESVLTAYINSLELTTSDLEGYLLVTECLRIFEDTAVEDLQKLLWKLAFGRWDRWNFGFVSENVFVFNRCISNIDHAVSKYFSTCMQKEEMETYIDNLLEQMNALDTQWHSSHSDLTSKWHVLFSKYVLIAYVLDSEDLDYLNFVPCLPEKFNNTYSKIKYNINVYIQEKLQMFP